MSRSLKIQKFTLIHFLIPVSWYNLEKLNEQISRNLNKHEKNDPFTSFWAQ